MLPYGFQSVVSLEPAAALQPDGAERQFQIVVDDQYLFRVDSEEMGRLRDRQTAFVHIGLGFQKPYLYRFSFGLRPDAMKFLLPRSVDMHIITNQPAGVVSCAFILSAGVAEKYKKFYHNANQYTEIRTGRQWYF